MKQVVRVRIHFRDGDQLKLDYCQSLLPTRLWVVHSLAYGFSGSFGPSQSTISTSSLFSRPLLVAEDCPLMFVSLDLCSLWRPPPSGFEQLSSYVSFSTSSSPTCSGFGSIGDGGFCSWMEWGQSCGDGVERYPREMQEMAEEAGHKQEYARGGEVTKTRLPALKLCVYIVPKEIDRLGLAHVCNFITDV